MANANEMATASLRHAKSVPTKPGADADAAVLFRDQRPLRKIITTTAVAAGLGGALLGAILMHQRDALRGAVVAVNGKVIDEGAFMHRMETVNGAAVIRQMTGEELQMQFAKKKGAAPTDAEFQARYDRLAKQPNFEQSVADRGMSMDDFKYNLRLDMAKANVLTAGLAVSDAEVEEFYRVNADKRNPNALFYQPEQAQIAVIITSSEATANSARKALDGGSPFDQVARAFSQDQSRVNGGLLPPILRGRTQSVKIPGLEETIFSMKIGDIVGPRKFRNVWWIFRCMDRAPEHLRKFDEVKEDARIEALKQKGIKQNGAKVEAEFREFQRDANVQSFRPYYTHALDFKPK